jgi:hypothetical protein
MLPDPLDSLASITTTIANRAEYQTNPMRRFASTCVVDKSLHAKGSELI